VAGVNLPRFPGIDLVRKKITTIREGGKTTAIMNA
jgi:hypothetical protein